MIAEAGVNHNCDVQLGYQLDRDRGRRGRGRHQVPELHRGQDRHPRGAALLGGARGSARARSGTPSTGSTSSRTRDFKALLGHARQVGLTAFSTPFDDEAVDFLASLDVPGLQDRLRRPHLPRPHRARGARGQADDPLHRAPPRWPRWRRRSRSAARAGNEQVVLLHCTLKYPCPPEGINLRMMEHLMRAFPEVPVGLSDHSLGISVPAGRGRAGRLHDREALHGRQDAARARRTTTSRWIPPELQAMVDGHPHAWRRRSARRRRALEPLERGGLPLRAPQRDLGGRASRAGTTITREMLTYKRPGTGISPPLPRPGGRPRGPRGHPGGHDDHLGDGLVPIDPRTRPACSCSGRGRGRRLSSAGRTHPSPSAEKGRSCTE